MALIDVDPAELLAAASRIESALPVGQDIGAGGTLGSSASAAGRHDMVSAIESFLDGWSFGVGVLNQDAQHLAGLLRLAGQAYTDAETKIGTAET